MPQFEDQQFTQYYELHGDPGNPPVLLATGLGGVGAEWGPLIQWFAEKHYVILPDQRGTGRTTHAPDGYTTQQLAADMVSLLDHLGVGPVHMVGASTGAAIGQYMALDFPRYLQTLTMAGAFAKFDAYAKRGSDVRRALVATADRRTRYEAYACFLFSPRYTRDHPEKVQAWIDMMVGLSEAPADLEITLKRIDMIASHDTVARLSEIPHASLAVCGQLDVAAPVPHSEQLVAAIPDSELVVIPDSGHLIELEKAEEFFEIVSGFIGGHQAPLAVGA